MDTLVSVDQAIARGKYLINCPVLFLFFGSMGLGIYLLVTDKYSALEVTIATIVIGTGLGWLYWSIAITKWRIWAFQNVRNVHELKKRAIQEKLIWPDGSVFVKTEIRTRVDKERLNDLESKFKLEDEFHDDLSVPAETIIFYARVKNFFQMIMMLAGVAGGVYFLKEGDYYIGVILSAGAAFLAYNEFKEATNATPQIILNDEGIQTISTPFYKWEQIRNEEAVTEEYSKRSRDYLIYDHPEGSEHLLLDEYKIDKRSLNKLLILYRGRSRASSSSRDR
ncbi:hypothetical protein [Pedobacter ginsengisoli]|uniref:hypothetical protein n=1 Tax=Pedobacter ginsengisoli TaxID=363852 RepID=UPI00254F4AD9|nr:hypothetical protein [Pedobacter ginsengisoli]